MRWPWVKRSTYEAVVAECGHLTSELNRALADYEMLAETVSWVKAHYYGPRRDNLSGTYQVGVEVDMRPITGDRVNLMRAEAASRYVKRAILRYMDGFESEMRKRETQ